MIWSYSQSSKRLFLHTHTYTNSCNICQGLLPRPTQSWNKDHGYPTPCTHWITQYHKIAWWAVTQRTSQTTELSKNWSVGSCTKMDTNPGHYGAAICPFITVFCITALCFASVINELLIFMQNMSRYLLEAAWARLHLPGRCWPAPLPKLWQVRAL